MISPQNMSQSHTQQICLYAMRLTREWASEWERKEINVYWVETTHNGARTRLRLMVAREEEKKSRNVIITYSPRSAFAKEGKRMIRDDDDENRPENILNIFLIVMLCHSENFLSLHRTTYKYSPDRGPRSLQQLRIFTRKETRNRDHSPDGTEKKSETTTTACVTKSEIWHFFCVFRRGQAIASGERKRKF